MRRIQDASSASLIAFVQESIEPRSWVRTDGWTGYDALNRNGYRHLTVNLSRHREPASEVLPLVHKAIALFKRWLLGTHQGAVSHEHLDYYRDEFVFRFNRRTSRSRGKLFYRLAPQAETADPTPYHSIVARNDDETF